VVTVIAVAGIGELAGMGLLAAGGVLQQIWSGGCPGRSICSPQRSRPCPRSGPHSAFVPASHRRGPPRRQSPPPTPRRQPALSSRPLVPADSPDCHPERVDQLLAGARRVWYLHGARLSRDRGDYPVRMARELGRRGRIVERHDYGSSSGAWVLVDLTAGPEPRPPAVPPDPRLACLTVD
jgi:hypothetical protein